jgi:type IV secretory pathway VirB10-like protein
MRRYITTVLGIAFTAVVVAIIAARGPDQRQESPAATLAATSTAAQATQLRAPAPMPPAPPAPPQPQPQPQGASPRFTPLPTQRDATAVVAARPAASAVARVIGEARQENDELARIDRELAEGLQEAADEAWRREAVAAQAAARHAAILESLATLRRSDALLATGDSDGVDDELARAAAALSGRTLLDVEAAREALAREDLYPARQYLEAALAEPRLPH